MRIRTKTKISALITFSLVLFLGLSIYLIEQRVANSSQKEILSGKIIDGVFDLSILTQDYLLYKEERAKEQWKLSYNKIGPSFDPKLFNTQEEIEIVEDLTQSYTELDSIFSKLTNSMISKELEDRLTSQLLIKLDKLVSESFKLASINQTQLTKALSFNIFIQSVVLLLIIVTLLNAYLTLKISSPLAKLTKGAEIIGKGNLKHKIDIKTKDEVGELATAFNKMTVDLKISRKKLQAFGKNLEKKVKERTKELEQSNKKLLEAQQRIIRSEKLATVGKLAGIMGHEIRNPLGVISNSIYFINMKLKGSIDEKIKRHLKIMQTEISNSDKIISDVLDFAMIKAPILVKAEINYVLNEAISKAVIPKTVKVKTDLGKNIPKVMIDVLQIKQVFTNIISNAVQAMPKGGELKISTSKIEKFISIAFKDTGMGIKKADIDKIFEPLFSTKAKGIGLGLTTCQNIIDGHKGKIKIESKEGKGTTFTIKLPIV